MFLPRVRRAEKSHGIWTEMAKRSWWGDKFTIRLRDAIPMIRAKRLFLAPNTCWPVTSLKATLGDEIQILFKNLKNHLELTTHLTASRLCRKCDIAPAGWKYWNLMAVYFQFASDYLGEGGMSGESAPPGGSKWPLSTRFRLLFYRAANVLNKQRWWHRRMYRLRKNILGLLHSVMEVLE